MPEESKPSESAELQREIVAYWVDVATSLGFPRSVGEIYGLIFFSAEPLSADDLAHQLKISRSGAGQGLKLLQEIGAIRPALAVPSRKEHFELQTDLGVLVGRFLNQQIFPKIDELDRRRTALAGSALDSTQSHLTARFEKLERWRSKASPVLTLLKALT